MSSCKSTMSLNILLNLPVILFLQDFLSEGSSALIEMLVQTPHLPLMFFLWSHLPFSSSPVFLFSGRLAACCSSNTLAALLPLHELLSLPETFSSKMPKAPSLATFRSLLDTASVKSSLITPTFLLSPCCFVFF